jgi:hypothetical protein
MSTKAAQPVPTMLSNLLEVIQHENMPVQLSSKNQTVPANDHDASISTSHTSYTTPNSPVPSDSNLHHPSDCTYKLVNYPRPIPHNATCNALMRQNTKLRAFCESAKRQMEADHASKKLMDAKNERLPNRLFKKSKKPNKR